MLSCFTNIYLTEDRIDLENLRSREIGVQYSKFHENTNATYVPPRNLRNEGMFFRSGEVYSFQPERTCPNSMCPDSLPI